MKVSGVILLEVISSFVTGLGVGWMPVSYQEKVSMVSLSHHIASTEQLSFNKLVIKQTHFLHGLTMPHITHPELTRTRTLSFDFKKLIYDQHLTCRPHRDNIVINHMFKLLIKPKTDAFVYRIRNVDHHGELRKLFSAGEANFSPRSSTCQLFF